MNVIGGIEKIKAYFPGAALYRYAERERNDSIARKMHMVGECIVKDRSGLIKLMDNLGLNIKNIESGLYIVHD